MKNMAKRVILITGTPAVGKTTLAKALVKRLNAQYVNLTEYAKAEGLILEEDRARATAIIDETNMRRKIRGLVSKANGDVVIDGHYAAAVTPKALVTWVFVLRRRPSELRELMRRRGYGEAKQKENLEAEVLDVCLIEALRKLEKEKVCELDVSAMPLDETLNSILEVLNGRRKCYAGFVDWMSQLEREGTLSDYLKP